MHVKRMKSVVRTIRISRDLDVLLQEDANAKKLPVNALISSILEKYAEWDRLADSFGIIGVHHDVFTRILLAVTDERIGEIGSELGEMLGREARIFWFKKPNVEPIPTALTPPANRLEEFLTAVSHHVRHTADCRWEIEWRAEECTVLYCHNLGLKWSLLFRHFVSTAAKALLGVLPVCETTEHAVLFRFPKTHRDRQAAET